MALTHRMFAELNGVGTPMVEITDDVDFEQSLVWTWGRNDWLVADPSPGSLSFTLDNSSGDYGPGCPTGTYAVGCAEGIGVRWWMGDPAVSTLGRSVLFRMSTPIPSFPTQSGGSSTVNITCVDLLARLQNRTMRSMYDEYVLGDPTYPPCAYWPLTETTGATAGLDVSGNGQPALMQAPTVQQANVQWAQGGGVPAENKGALYLTAGPQGSPTTPWAAGQFGLNYLSTNSEVSAPGDAGFTVSVWFTAPALSSMSGGGHAALFEMTLDTGISIGVFMDRDNGTLLRAESSDRVGFAVIPGTVGTGTNLLAMTVYRNAGVVWVKHQLNASTPFGGPLAGNPSTIRLTSLTVGSAPLSTLTADCMDWTGALHHVTVWPVDAMSIQSALYLVGRDGFPENSAQRMKRLADWFQSTQTITRYNASSAPLPDVLETQDTDGQSMLSVMSTAMRAEGSHIISNIFRDAVAGSPAVMTTEQLATFGSPEWSNVKVYPRFVLDAKRHTVGVPAVESVAATRVASASAQGRNGVATYTDPVLLRTTTQTTSLAAASSDAAYLARIAQYRVAQTRSVLPQITQVSLDLRTSEADYLTVGQPGFLTSLSQWTQPGVRLQIQNMPANVLGRGTTTHMIVGGTETHDLMHAQVTFNLAPADQPPPAMIYNPALTYVDDSASRCAVDDCTLSGDHTAAATTINVVPGVVPWTTDSGDYPLHLAIGGEQINCPTAPTTAGGVTTFTGVTRGFGATNPRVLRDGTTVDLWAAPCFGI